MQAKAAMRTKYVFVSGGMLAVVGCLTLLSHALRPRGGRRPETGLLSAVDVGAHPSGAADRASRSEQAPIETPVTLRGAVSVMHGPEGAVLGAVLTVPGNEGWRDAAEYDIVLDEEGTELALSMEWKMAEVAGASFTQDGIRWLRVTDYVEMVGDEGEAEELEGAEPRSGVASVPSMPEVRDGEGDRPHESEIGQDW